MPRKGKRVSLIVSRATSDKTVKRTFAKHTDQKRVLIVFQKVKRNRTQVNSAVLMHAEDFTNKIRKVVAFFSYFVSPQHASRRRSSWQVFNTNQRRSTYMTLASCRLRDSCILMTLAWLVHPHGGVLASPGRPKPPPQATQAASRHKADGDAHRARASSREVAPEVHR